MMRLHPLGVQDFAQPSVDGDVGTCSCMYSRLNLAKFVFPVVHFHHGPITILTSVLQRRSGSADDVCFNSATLSPDLTSV